MSGSNSTLLLQVPGGQLGYIAKGRDGTLHEAIINGLMRRETNTRKNAFWRADSFPSHASAILSYLLAVLPQPGWVGCRSRR